MALKVRNLWPVILLCWDRRAATVTEMIVHFICRGNAFRSIIAEACLNSLKSENLKAVSSGTAAAVNRTGNLAAYIETLGLLAKNGIREYAKTGYGDQLTPSRLAGADVVICMNQRVYDECQQLVSLPASTRIWSVADIGEPGRVAHTESGKTVCREEAYQEIVESISRLISELSYSTHSHAAKRYHVQVVFPDRDADR
jgi:protein-tyrosine-phosphatase